MTQSIDNQPFIRAWQTIPIYIPKANPLLQHSMHIDLHNPFSKVKSISFPRCVVASHLSYWFEPPPTNKPYRCMIKSFNKIIKRRRDAWPGPGGGGATVSASKPKSRKTNRKPTNRLSRLQLLLPRLQPQHSRTDYICSPVILFATLLCWPCRFTFILSFPPTHSQMDIIILGKYREELLQGTGDAAPCQTGNHHWLPHPFLKTQGQLHRGGDGWLLPCCSFIHFCSAIGLCTADRSTSAPSVKNMHS